MNSVHIQTNWKSTVSHIILGNKNLATYWLFFYNILSVLGWFQAFFSFSSLFWSMLPVYMNWGDQEASTGNKSYCVKADQDRKTAPPHCKWQGISRVWSTLFIFKKISSMDWAQRRAQSCQPFLAIPVFSSTTLRISLETVAKIQSAEI